MIFRPDRLRFFIVLITLMALLHPGRAGAGETAVVENGFTKMSLGGKFEYLEDPGGELTIKSPALHEQPGRFTTAAEDGEAFGFTDSIYWTRFTVENRSGKDRTIYLESEYPLTDIVELYATDGTSWWLVNKLGDRLPFDRRQIQYRVPVFSLSLQAGETATYLMKWETSSSMVIRLNLWEPREFTGNLDTHELLVGIYFGALIILVLYNFLIYPFLRDKEYLWFAIFHTFFILCLSGISGLSFHYLWPNMVWWANQSIPFFILGACATGVTFTYEFLEVRQKSQMVGKFFRAFIGATSLLCAASLVMDYGAAIRIATAFVVLSSVISMSVAFIGNLHRDMHARFYIAGWSIVLLGACITAFKNLGYLPANLFTTWALFGGPPVEATLISIALGLRFYKMLEDEKQLKHSAAVAEAKAKAKSDFLARMSHELRTPLNAIIGFTRLAEEKDDATSRKEYLRLIGDSGKTLLHLVNDILDFSRIESGKLELVDNPFNPRATIESCLEPLGLEARRKGLGFSVQFLEELPDKVMGDSLRVKQVLLNLVSNALKFTPQGDIAVVVSVSVGDEGKSFIRVSVKDSGIGIKQDDLEKIFESFTQADRFTSRTYGGTGLGVTISKELVEAMGGRMTARSEEGVGSTFTFTIPLVVSVDGEEEAEEESAVPGKGPFNILLVEDNPLNQKVVKDFLNHNHHQVLVARDGEEGVRQAECHSFDLIIMDQRMPKMEGTEAIRKIRAREGDGKKTPIIALTANVQKEDAEKMLAAGANSFLPKPVDFSLLLKEIQKLAGGAAQNREIHLPADLPEEADSDAPVFDCTELRDKVFQNEDELNRYLDLFKENIRKQVKDLEQAIDTEDLAAIERCAHTIKGSSLQIKAHQLSGASKEIEYAGKEHNAAKARELWKKFYRFYNELINEIDATTK